MAGFDTDLTSKTYITFPTWDGKLKTYPSWKKKLTSCMSQVGCGSMVATDPNAPKKLLTAAQRAKMAVDMEVEKDDDKKAKMKETLKYCMMSDKAYGYLCNSIDTSTAKGQYVYDLITNFQDDEDYPGGDFKKAWEKLCKMFEKKDKQRVLSYEDKYFKHTFDDDFYPGSSLLKFDQKRKDMNRNIDPARKVDDKQFIQHVLAKLPTGKDGEEGPYQAKRAFIQQKIELWAKENKEYTIDDLTLDLTEVYNNLHPESSDSESDDDKKKKSKGETGLAAFHKQPKKKCNNCGKWGHISKFCKNKNNQGRSNFGGGRGSSSNRGSSGGGRGSGFGSANGNGSGRKPNNKYRDMTCHYCHRKGHIKSQCFKLKNKNQFQPDEHGAVAFVTIDSSKTLCLGCGKVNALPHPDHANVACELYCSDDGSCAEEVAISGDESSAYMGTTDFDPDATCELSVVSGGSVQDAPVFLCDPLKIGIPDTGSPKTEGEGTSSNLIATTSSNSIATTSSKPSKFDSKAFSAKEKNTEDGTSIGDEETFAGRGSFKPNISSNQSGDESDEESVDDSSMKLAALAVKDDDDSFEWIPPIARGTDDDPRYDEIDFALRQERMESRVGVAASVLMSWDEESCSSSSSSSFSFVDDDKEDNSSQDMNWMDISTVEQLEELALMALDSDVEILSLSQEPDMVTDKVEMLEVDRAIAECMQQDEYEKMEIDLALQGLEETPDTESIRLYWDGTDTGYKQSTKFDGIRASATETPKSKEGRLRYLQGHRNEMEQCVIGDTKGNTFRRTCLVGSSNDTESRQPNSPATDRSKDHRSCEQKTEIASGPTDFRACTATDEERYPTSRMESKVSTVDNRDMSNAVGSGTNATGSIRWAELDSLTQSALVRMVLYTGSVDILEGDVWEDVRRKLLTIVDAAKFQWKRAQSGTASTEECIGELDDVIQECERNSDFHVASSQASREWKNAIFLR